MVVSRQVRSETLLAVSAVALLACLSGPAPAAPPGAAGAPATEGAAPGSATPAPVAPAASGTPASPPGAEKSVRTEMLEAGARALQTGAPTSRLDLHLTGIHPLKGMAGHQMVAHHYCEQVNEDFAQCALFDDDGEQARLNGIEYIISARVFESLPAEERAYWHPHNYEILSGQLVAPGLPDAAETAFMRGKMNSYGKTWQLWDTGAPGRAAAALPAGDPLLAWSLNRDGEADPALLDDYQRRQRIDPEKKRAERGELKTLARPQEGVDALKGRFGRDTRDLPGVQERKAQP